MTWYDPPSYDYFWKSRKAVEPDLSVTVTKYAGRTLGFRGQTVKRKRRKKAKR